MQWFAPQSNVLKPSHKINQGYSFCLIQLLLVLLSIIHLVLAFYGRLIHRNSILNDSIILPGLYPWQEKSGIMHLDSLCGSIGPIASLVMSPLMCISNQIYYWGFKRNGVAVVNVSLVSVRYYDILGYYPFNFKLVYHQKLSIGHQYSYKYPLFMCGDFCSKFTLLKY